MTTGRQASMLRGWVSSSELKDEMMSVQSLGFSVSAHHLRAKKWYGKDLRDECGLGICSTPSPLFSFIVVHAQQDGDIASCTAALLLQ